MSELNKTIGQKMAELARSTASHAPAGFLSSIAVLVKAKDDWDGGPVSMWQSIEKNYPGDAFDVFPEMGSKGGNNPALFMLMVPTGKDGKLKEKEHDFYNVYADNLPPSVINAQRKDWLERLGNEKMKTDGIPPEFLAEYQGNSHKFIVARDDELTRVKNALKNYRKAVKIGFELKFQLLKVNELGGCHAEVVPSRANDGTYTNRVRVRSTLPGRELEDNEGMSVNAFLKLDPKKAWENGATFAALMATKKREQEEGEGTAATTRIANAEQAKKAVLDLHDYFDTITRDPKQEALGQWVKWLNSKAGEDTFMSLYDMKDFITDVIEKTHKPAERRQILSAAIADKEMADKKAAA